LRSTFETTEGLPLEQSFFGAPDRLLGALLAAVAAPTVQTAGGIPPRWEAWSPFRPAACHSGPRIRGDVSHGTPAAGTSARDRICARVRASFAGVARVVSVAV